MTNQPVENLINALQQKIRSAPEGLNVEALRNAVDALNLAKPSKASNKERVKIWFLLDRSGSMSNLAEDVVGGFNQFVTEQGNKPGHAKMSAIQFDDNDPFEIIIDAQRVGQIPPLTSDIFQPRGLTPLYDAIGQLISRADERIADREASDEPTEDQLVIVFTDGLENASRKFSQTQVFELIRDRRDQDWTFVFMGTNQDSYEEGHKIGLVDGNVQNYDPSSASVDAAFGELSRGTGAYRAKPRRQRHQDKDDFFKGKKEAENTASRDRKS